MFANVLQKADSHISALERRLVEKREQGEGMSFIHCTHHAFSHRTPAYWSLLDCGMCRRAAQSQGSVAATVI